MKRFDWDYGGMEEQPGQGDYVLHTEAQRLIEGLREAVQTLYGCRYSEQPLARKLDALLKEITGKSQADLTLEWIEARAKGEAQ